MSLSPTRAYTWIASIGLFLQGGSTLAAQLVPAIDHAMPMLLEETRMIPSHSLLHIASGLIGFAALRSGGRATWLFALGFGTFYVALAIVGIKSGLPLGIGLQPFDHSFHAVLGGFGLLAAAIESLRFRATSRSDA
jgi:hypothetical protein